MQDHIICAIQNFKILITRRQPSKTAAESLKNAPKGIKKLNTHLHLVLPAIWNRPKALIGRWSERSKREPIPAPCLESLFQDSFGQQPLDY